MHFEPHFDLIPSATAFADAPYFYLTLWVLTILFVIGFVLPALIGFLGFGRCTVRAVRVGSAPSNQKAPILLQIYDQLKDLGFEPLGLLRFSYWCSGGRWRWTNDSRAFYRREENCGVLVGRNRISESDKVIFWSVFADGKEVRTTNVDVGVFFKRGNVNQELETADMVEMITKHREAVNRLREAGGTVAFHPIAGLFEKDSQPSGFAPDNKAVVLKNLAIELCCFALAIGVLNEAMVLESASAIFLAFVAILIGLMVPLGLLYLEDALERSRPARVLDVCRSSVSLESLPGPSKGDGPSSEQITTDDRHRIRDRLP
jgi:hypothetical protein